MQKQNSLRRFAGRFQRNGCVDDGAGDSGFDSGCESRLYSAAGAAGDAEKAGSAARKLNVLEPFLPGLDLYKAMRYKYMKVRFGRISVDYYKRLEKYLFEDLMRYFKKELGMKIMSMDAILCQI